MRTSSLMQNRPSISQRLLGGIGLFVFLGAFFVMPLCAALAICTMPCCEHGDDNGATTIESAAMMACQTECSIRSDEATSTAAPSVAPESSATRGAPLVTVIADAPERPAIVANTEQHTAGFLRGSDDSLQILNSTFRI